MRLLRIRTAAMVLACVSVLAACSSAAGRMVLAEGVTEYPSTGSGSSTDTRPTTAEPLPEEVLDSCEVDGIVRAVEVVGDIAYLAGEFESVTPIDGPPVERLNLAACDTSAGAVTDWYPEDGADGIVLDLAATDRWVYVAGEFTTVGGSRARHVARLSAADGRPDRAWRPDADDVVMMVEPRRGGSVYVGGHFTVVAGEEQAALARIESDGRLDAEFRPSFEFRDGRAPGVYAIHEPRGEALYVGGRFSAVNGSARQGAASIEKTRGRDTLQFAPDLRDTNPNDDTVQVVGIHLIDDAVYLCGDYWQIDGIGVRNAQRNIGRFDPMTGAADNVWMPTTNGGVQVCLPNLAADAMLIGGHYERVNGTGHQKLAALSLADGSVIPWVTANSREGVWGLAVTEDGAVVVGGAFNRFDGRGRDGFAVVTAGGPTP